MINRAVSCCCTPKTIPRADTKTWRSSSFGPRDGCLSRTVPFRLPQTETVDVSSFATVRGISCNGYLVRELLVTWPFEFRCLDPFPQFIYMLRYAFDCVWIYRKRSFGLLKGIALRSSKNHVIKGRSIDHFCPMSGYSVKDGLQFLANSVRHSRSRGFHIERCNHQPSRTFFVLSLTQS